MNRGDLIAMKNELHDIIDIDASKLLKFLHDHHFEDDTLKLEEEYFPWDAYETYCIGQVIYDAMSKEIELKLSNEELNQHSKQIRSLRQQLTEEKEKLEKQINEEKERLEKYQWKLKNTHSKLVQEATKSTSAQQKLTSYQHDAQEKIMGLEKKLTQQLKEYQSLSQQMNEEKENLEITLKDSLCQKKKTNRLLQMEQMKNESLNEDITALGAILEIPENNRVLHYNPQIDGHYFDKKLHDQVVETKNYKFPTSMKFGPYDKFTYEYEDSGLVRYIIEESSTRSFIFELDITKSPEASSLFYIEIVKNKEIRRLKMKIESNTEDTKIFTCDKNYIINDKKQGSKCTNIPSLVLGYHTSKIHQFIEGNPSKKRKRRIEIPQFEKSLNF
jgi:hypothetical protein